MSEHTPGPWTYGAKLSGSENHKGFVLRDSEGYWLADISPRDEDGKQGEVNARLIAAAPELLAALKAFVHSYDLQDVTDAEYPELGQARAAIAKGEPS